MIKAVLFDLDGTLLPMDQDNFTTVYMGMLTKRFVPLGFEPKDLIDALWKGTEKMFLNDGTHTNEEVFWEYFTGRYGPESRKLEPVFRDFYMNEFNDAKSVCSPKPVVKDIISFLKEAGVRRILATNPMFPLVATQERVQWAGLEPEDFELITAYEDARHSKPNPEYFKDIMRETGLDPKDCLMVGNDATEDMVAEKLGMDTYLVTDCLINRKGLDVGMFKHGTMDEFLGYLKSVVKG